MGARRGGVVASEGLLSWPAEEAGSGVEALHPQGSKLKEEDGSSGDAVCGGRVRGNTSAAGSGPHPAPGSPESPHRRRRDSRPTRSSWAPPPSPSPRCGWGPRPVSPPLSVGRGCISQPRPARHPQRVGSCCGRSPVAGPFVTCREARAGAGIPRPGCGSGGRRWGPRGGKG